MKLMQNGLFIDEIWAKIAVGTLSYCWNLILVVGSQFGSNLAIGTLYYHWDSNLAVGSTQTWYGPSDHVGERVDFSQKMAKKSVINWHPRRFIVNRRYIADFLTIFFVKNRPSDISPRNVVSLGSDTRYIADISRHLLPWLKYANWESAKKKKVKYQIFISLKPIN